MARWRPRARAWAAESGAASSEQIAVIVIVAAVIGGVIAIGLPDRTQEVGEVAVDCLFDGSDECVLPVSSGGGDDGGDVAEPVPDNPDDICGFGPPPGYEVADDGSYQVPLDDGYHGSGQESAADLSGILDGVEGLGNPYGFAVEIGSPAFDIIPVDHDAAHEAYPDLVDFFADNAHRLDDPSFAAGLLNELGPDGVQNLIDLSNTYGLWGSDGVDQDESYRDYVQPLARLLGAADRSGHLDDEVWEAMVDPAGPTDQEILDSLADPDMLDFDLNDPEVEIHPELRLHVEIHRQRAYTILLHEADLSSRTTAELASGLLNGPLPFKLDAIGLVEGYGGSDFQGDPELADARWAALQALADDPAAAALFFQDPANAGLAEAWLSDDAYDHADIFLLLAEQRSDLSRDEVVEAMQQAAQNAIDADCTA